MSEKWFSPSAQQQLFAGHPSTRMFCFPYAGAGHTAYNFWKHTTLNSVELAFVKLPGRGVRLREPIASSLIELANKISSAIAISVESNRNQSIALYGHSMGALLAFETARALEVVHGLKLEALFASGCAAPSKRPTRSLSELPDSALVDAIISMDGMPVDIRRDPELVAFFLPILRADIALCEAYQYQRSARLTCPITVFGGASDDRVLPEDLEDWERETSNRCQTNIYPGGHFFIIEHQATMLRALQTVLVPHKGIEHAIA